MSQKRIRRPRFSGRRATATATLRRDWLRLRWNWILFRAWCRTWLWTLFGRGPRR